MLTKQIVNNSVVKEATALAHNRLGKNKFSA